MASGYLNMYRCNVNLSGCYFLTFLSYEALQVYILLPPGINFRISLKRSEITQMGYFCQDLTKKTSLGHHTSCIIHHTSHIPYYIGHSLRLNADVADTALQKSLRQFCKYCWPNLNDGKIYIFISNTFSM